MGTIPIAPISQGTQELGTEKQSKNLTNSMDVRKTPTYNLFLTN